MIEYLTNFFMTIQTNPMAAGLVSSTLIGSAVYMLKEVPRKVFLFLVDSFTVTVDIVEENSYTAFQTFEHVLQKSKLYYVTGKFQLSYRTLLKSVDMVVGEGGYFFSKIGGK